MIYLAVYSGVRLSELAGITWEDINFTDKTLTINKQRMYITTYGVFERKTKTESGNRIVSLPDVVLSLLNEYKVFCKEQRLILGNLWEGAAPGTSFIFLNSKGRPIFPLWPSKWFNKFLKKNDFPKLTFHGLRHSHASLLISQGIDIVTVSERLGHSNKSITLNTYSHSIKSKDRTASDKLEELLKNKNKLSVPQVSHDK